jgi:hypothetical protein
VFTGDAEPEFGGQQRGQDSWDGSIRRAAQGQDGGQVAELSGREKTIHLTLANDLRVGCRADRRAAVTAERGGTANLAKALDAITWGTVGRCPSFGQ